MVPEARMLPSMVEARDTIVGMLDTEEQRVLVKQVREVIRVAPLFRPSAFGSPMSVEVTNAGPEGWVADERGYRYQSFHPVLGHGHCWPPIPESWKALADRWDYGARWDCAHIVWYDPAARDGEGAQLGWHRDETEHDLTGTIVTVSLGAPAMFGVREREGMKSSRVILSSGSVVVFKGPTRNVLHKVTRVLPPDMFSPLDRPGRFALSIRSGAGIPEAS